MYGSGLVFKPWPKIPRLNRNMIVTEKIDGTNAAVIVAAAVGDAPEWAKRIETEDGGHYIVGAQSRTRLIHPDDDNHGFAKWVWANAEKLAMVLGPGHHHGEWWGSGIQRGYGFPTGDKRFSLFNVTRYGDATMCAAAEFELAELAIVPVLMAETTFNTATVAEALDLLRTRGSVAAPGFMRAEGVIVFHTAAGVVFKALVEGDELPKGVA